jgi:photosynthetic reaction center cytochrome c subunit
VDAASESTSCKLYPWQKRKLRISIMSGEMRNRNAGLRNAVTMSLAIILVLLCAPRTSYAQASGQPAVARQSAGTEQGAPATSSAAAAPTAGEKFKNVQVLKDIPADTLIPSMNFISASLGADCAYCHVNPFEKDEKPEKATARKMIAMTLAINKDNFESHREVTCNTCHRGAAKPVGIPQITEAGTAAAAAPAPEKAGAASAVETMPSAEVIVEKYTQLIGGLDAVNKLSTRVDRGMIEGGRINGPLEETFKTPGKALSILHTPQGDFTQGTEGVTSWQMNPRGQVRDHSGVELITARQAANFTRMLDIKKNFTQMRVVSKEKVGDQDAYQIFAQAADGSGRVRLFFETQSGLLARLVSYEQSPMGILPTQFDYSDYREVSGVKVPFVVRISRLGPGNDVTEHFTEIKFNTGVDDGKFAKPAPKPAAAPANN